MEIKTSSLLIGNTILIILIAIILFFNFLFSESSVNSIQQDLNVLKQGQQELAELIIQQEQTIKYINENCKVYEDNNYTTTLVCNKVKQ